MPVLINGVLPLQFVLDSGSADVSLPEDVFSVLRRTGTITNEDYIGTGNYQLADGSTVQSDRFYIRELKIGPHILKHISASIGDKRGPLLLGQSFLRKFASVEIENRRHVLALGAEGSDTNEAVTLPPSPASTAQANPFADLIPAPSPGAKPVSPYRGDTVTPPLDNPWGVASIADAPPFDPTKSYTVLPQERNVTPGAPIDTSKLKLTDVSLAYGPLLPNDFKFIVANAGPQRVSEITIGYHEAPGRCTANLTDYDGFKKFSSDSLGRRLYLTPGDSVVLETQFSAKARGFCIISAR